VSALRVIASLLVIVSCSRSTVTSTNENAAPKKKVDKEPEKKEAPAVTEEADAAPLADEGDDKRKLEAFLKVIPANVPTGAYAHAPVKGAAPVPKGFDPLTAKGTTTKYPDSDVKVIDLELGASSFGWAIAVIRGGKVATLYDDVQHYALDPVGGHLALDHVRAEGGKRVRVRELVDVAKASTSPLPTMHCTDTIQFVEGGSRVLGYGFEAEKPGMPHAYICMFDVVGKLLLEIDAGPHFHHAASIDFINWHVGVLPKDPAVVYATREYRPYGNYDLMLLDTRPPHAGKLARLATPNLQPSDPRNVELDLAETTMASAEVKFRAKSPAGWFWKWQNKKLADVP
jgi:hypothetical protein